MKKFYKNCHFLIDFGKNWLFSSIFDQKIDEIDGRSKKVIFLKNFRDFLSGPETPQKGVPRPLFSKIVDFWRFFDWKSRKMLVFAIKIELPFLQNKSDPRGGPRVPLTRRHFWPQKGSKIVEKVAFLTPPKNGQKLTIFGGQKPPLKKIEIFAKNRWFFDKKIDKIDFYQKVIVFGKKSMIFFHFYQKITENLKNFRIFW